MLDKVVVGNFTGLFESVPRAFDLGVDEIGVGKGGKVVVLADTGGKSCPNGNEQTQHQGGGT